MLTIPTTGFRSGVKADISVPGPFKTTGLGDKPTRPAQYHQNDRNSLNRSGSALSDEQNSNRHQQTVDISVELSKGMEVWSIEPTIRRAADHNGYDIEWVMHSLELSPSEYKVESRGFRRPFWQKKQSVSKQLANLSQHERYVLEYFLTEVHSDFSGECSIKSIKFVKMRPAKEPITRMPWRGIHVLVEISDAAGEDRRSSYNSNPPFQSRPHGFFRVRQPRSRPFEFSGGQHQSGGNAFVANQAPFGGFGAGQRQSGGSAFGAGQRQSLFGSAPPQSGLFGAGQRQSLFGSGPQQSGLFGGGQSQSLFGGGQPQPRLFGGGHHQDIHSPRTNNALTDDKVRDDTIDEVMPVKHYRSYERRRPLRIVETEPRMEMLSDLRLSPRKEERRRTLFEHEWERTQSRHDLSLDSLSSGSDAGDVPGRATPPIHSPFHRNQSYSLRPANTRTEIPDAPAPLSEEAESGELQSGEMGYDALEDPMSEEHAAEPSQRIIDELLAKYTTIYS